MNISPSDTDVRQGYAIAGGEAPGKAATTDQGAPGTTESSLAAPESDAHSQEVAASADRTAAREAAHKLQEQLNAADTGLKIRVLDDARSSVQVEVVDERSNKVLRKIPQDEVLKLSASIKEMSGILVNKPA